MKIVLVTVTYPPEVRAIAGMMRELAEGLQTRGHEVTVVTSRPLMGVGPTAPEETKIASVENGILVLRAPVLPCYRRSYIIRGLAQLLMPGRFVRLLARHGRHRADGVIVYSPPLTLASVGERLVHRGCRRFLLNIQDIFPQNAIDLGILKNKFLIAFFECMEANAYARADAITCHTVSSTRLLNTQKHIPQSKLSTVPNWIDCRPYEKAEPGDFRRRYGIPDGSFVLLFSGIIGPSQELDLMLETARSTADLPVQYLVVGDGSEKKRLAEKARRMGLTNVRFEPYVGPAEYPSLVKEMDAGLICLSARNKTPVIPGKVLGFMAARKPVIAFLNGESDGHALIRESGCGYSCFSGDGEAREAIVRRMYAGASAGMGNKGYEYVEKNFSCEACIDAIERLISV